MSLWIPRYITIREAQEAIEARFKEMGIKDGYKPLSTEAEIADFRAKVKAWEEKHQDEPWGLELAKKLDLEAGLKKTKTSEQT